MPNPFSKAWSFFYYRFVHAPRGGGKPVPSSALDEEYKSGHWDHFFGPDEKARHDTLLELIYAQPGKIALLDLGCGSGRLASMLNPARLGSYLGVDLSEEGLRKARALNLPHGRFEVGNFETWRPRDTYDVITFNECLGYARHPAKTAAAFARCLKPGGVIIVSHFRWGNHAAIWQSLERNFTVETKRTAVNAKGQTWDLHVLRPRA